MKSGPGRSVAARFGILLVAVIVALLTGLNLAVAEEGDVVVRWPLPSDHSAGSHSAWDVALSPDGSEIYVIDSGPPRSFSRVGTPTVFDQRGQKVRTFGPSNVRRLTVGADGTVFVLAGDEVLALDAFGLVLRRWPGWEDGSDLAVSPDGVVYVTHSGGVSILAEDGGSELVIIDYRGLIAFDHQGRLLIATTTNDSGVSVSVFENHVWTETVSLFQHFEGIRGFVVGIDGSYIVASEVDVGAYERDGTIGRGIPFGGFDIDSQPGGVAVDQCGSVYVAGSGSADTQHYLHKAVLAENPSPCFIDTFGNQFQAAASWLGEQGITRGCNPPLNDHFCPRDYVTRGQMAAFLVRAMGYSDNGGGDLFTDTQGHLFGLAIDRLATAGVTKGCNPPANDRYCPDDLVTRGQMAAFLVRAMGYSDNGGGNLFTDDDGHLFENAIDKLGTAGVTLGCNPPTNDKYCPDDFVTRGQMAAFLKRALG